MHETAVVGLTVHQALRNGRYGGEKLQSADTRAWRGAPGSDELRL
jgi:hypothetical protein